MKKKLMLKLDETVIFHAEKHARAAGITVDQMITNYIQFLDQAYPDLVDGKDRRCHGKNSPSSAGSKGKSEGLPDARPMADLVGILEDDKSKL